ncbi:hypothetical protein NQ315_013395 [Exocentrus adspersus]|uniref:Uncharacterized protein n=1 Tax=Exocentrus adspersus TaxID=1586481 RepID=A0AAV8VS19_9CUCU|nr:hypothetical protein NQ315_013395 [Exocentrus adspersus]
MTNIKLSCKAYCKMILHAVKYPHAAVNGVLLAKKSSLHSDQIEFVDVVPLFHISINLTPLAEIALMMVNSTDIAIHKGSIPLKIAQHSDGNFVPCDNLNISFDSDNTINTCITLLEKLAFNNLIDFDNHFDNIKLDWKNIRLNEEIEKLK